MRSVINLWSLLLLQLKSICSVLEITPIFLGPRGPFFLISLMGVLPIIPIIPCSPCVPLSTIILNCLSQHLNETLIFAGGAQVASVVSSKETLNLKFFCQTYPSKSVFCLKKTSKIKTNTKPNNTGRGFNPSKDTLRVKTL